MSSGRWPEGWHIPSEKEMRKVLQNITLLIRVENQKNEDTSLHAINLDKLDLYNTNITCEGDVTWRHRQVKGLKMRFAYPAYIPVADRYAGDLRVTVEDIFANMATVDLLRPRTLVEVFTRFVRIEFDSRLGRVWRPIILVYDKDN